MKAKKNIYVQKVVFSGATLWEEDGIVSFYFEENTIIDAELVFQIFNEFDSVNSMQNKFTLLNLEGVEGATLEGLSMLNQKLENFSRQKAILVNNENTEVIGRVFANSFNHKKPTKVFRSALEADVWMN